MFDKIIADYRSKVFLLNMARQKQAGIIDNALWKKIIIRIKKSNEPENIFQALSNRVSGWETGASPLRDFYFGSTKSPKTTESTLLLRVASFSDLARNLTFSDDDMNYAHSEKNTNTRSTLTMLERKLQRKRLPEAEAQSISADIHQFFNVRNVNREMRDMFHFGQESILPPVLKASLRLKTLGLRGSDEQENGEFGKPVFVTPIEQKVADDKCLLRSIDASRSKADKVRDSLGLDHFGKHYKGRRIALGYMLLRFDSLRHTRISRPTPLDNAINFRFKGFHGNVNGIASQWGRAADLHKLSVGDENIAGHKEFVVADSTVKDGPSVFVGFLGITGVPRGDIRVGSKEIPHWDEAFLSSLLDGATEDEIFQQLAKDDGK